MVRDDVAAYVGGTAPAQDLPMPCRLRPTATLAPVLVAASLALAACDDFSPAPVEFDQGDVVAVGDVHTLELRGRVLSSLPATPPEADPAKVALGRQLFWDPILSGDRDVACATCHLPDFGYTDGRRRSIGVGGVGRGPGRVAGSVPLVDRNAQSVLNTAWNGIDELGRHDVDAAPMFHDNRVAGHAAQAVEAIRSLREMRGENVAEAAIDAELAARLGRIPEYALAFGELYGGGADRAAGGAVAAVPITLDAVGDALGHFQRTLVANASPFDRWMRGEPDAMSAAEVSGMQEFVIAGCADCHSGALFSDFETRVLGIEEGAGVSAPDDGDGGFAFRTPTLRQLAFTAPYFHAGQRATLGAAVDFYDERRRSSNPAVPSSALDPELLEVPEMDDGRGAAIARFLDALNDEDFDRTVPVSVPSGLPVGGRLR